VKSQRAVSGHRRQRATPRLFVERAFWASRGPRTTILAVAGLFVARIEKSFADAPSCVGESAHDMNIDSPTLALTFETTMAANTSAFVLAPPAEPASVTVAPAVAAATATVNAVAITSSAAAAAVATSAASTKKTPPVQAQNPGS